MILFLIILLVSWHKKNVSAPIELNNIQIQQFDVHPLKLQIEGKFFTLWINSGTISTNSFSNFVKNMYRICSDGQRIAVNTNQLLGKFMDFQ